MSPGNAAAFEGEVILEKLVIHSVLRIEERAIGIILAATLGIAEVEDRCRLGVRPHWAEGVRRASAALLVAGTAGFAIRRVPKRTVGVLGSASAGEGGGAWHHAEHNPQQPPTHAAVAAPACRRPLRAAYAAIIVPCTPEQPLEQPPAARRKQKSAR